MAERLIAPVLKTGGPLWGPRVRIPPLPPIMDDPFETLKIKALKPLTLETESPYCDYGCCFELTEVDLEEGDILYIERFRLSNYKQNFDYIL